MCKSLNEADRNLRSESIPVLTSVNLCTTTLLCRFLLWRTIWPDITNTLLKHWVDSFIKNVCSNNVPNLCNLLATTVLKKEIHCVNPPSMSCILTQQLFVQRNFSSISSSFTISVFAPPLLPRLHLFPVTDPCFL